MRVSKSRIKEFTLNLNEINKRLVSKVHKNYKYVFQKVE